MTIRRAFLRWLFPAAVLLPLWLLVGWGVFQAGGWAFLWVLFIAIPSVFVGQLLLTLLVRARPSVQASGAVSWWDVAGFTLWHGLTVAVGLYNQQFFGIVLALAIVVGFGMFWLTGWQLSREGSARFLRRDGGPDGKREGPRVIVVEEGRSSR